MFFIGKLKELKLELDLNVGTLDTDIKSLKKAAKQGIGPELNKRIKQITDTGLLEIKDDFKIYWGKFSIAKLLPGKDYLDPELALIIDDIVEVADALTDILYVTYGAGHSFGVDLDKCFDEVQSSNMSKLGENGKPIYNESGKVMKGPNYFAPNLKKII